MCFQDICSCNDSDILFPLFIELALEDFKHWFMDKMRYKYVYLDCSYHTSQPYDCISLNIWNCSGQLEVHFKEAIYLVNNTK